MQDKKNDNMMEIDLQEILLLLLHNWWLILVCGILSGILAFSYSTFILTPKYDSTTGIYVMSKQNGDTLSYSDAQLSAQLTKDYEKLITSRYVLETVISQCGLNEKYESLLSRVSVRNATDTRIIYITVKDKDPMQAQFIANAIREVASDHITSVTEVQAVNVVDTANLPTDPSEPSIPRNTVIGVAAGFFLCIAFVIIRYLMDNTIKSSEDVEKYLGWSTLALIPMIEDSTDKKTVKKKSTVSSRTSRDNEVKPVR